MWDNNWEAEDISLGASVSVPPVLKKFQMCLTLQVTNFFIYIEVFFIYTEVQFLFTLDLICVQYLCVSVIH